MRKLFFYILLVSVSGAALAQTETENNPKAKPRSTPSPDFPGEFVIDYGLNYFIDPSPEMTTDPWRSPTWNIYYAYPVQINESRFSFNPSVGVGMETFAFSAPVTLVDSSGITVLRNITDLPQFSDADNITYSKLSTTYIDMPLEFRIHSRKNDHKRSWFIALGGKVGVLVDTKTKIKYSESGVRKVNKNKYHYNVSTWRYGALARIGYGPLTFWGYYRGSTLFRGNKTNNIENPGMFSFGISLTTF
jgi:hypothetical protein